MYTMLTQQQAQQFALENQTVTDNILKEHYQIYILDQLYKSNFGNNLVFKGGTALKLAYNSIRFSEDLDFSILNKVDYVDFKKTVQSLVHKFSESKFKIFMINTTLFTLK
jgi:predicted nucleotidyltransferase component of viral defense system